MLKKQDTVENARAFLSLVSNDPFIVEIIDSGLSHFEVYIRVLSLTSDANKALAAGVAFLLLGFFPKCVRIASRYGKKFLVVDCLKLRRNNFGCRSRFCGKPTCESRLNIVDFYNMLGK